MNVETIPNRINALRTVGVPYAEGYDEIAIRDFKAQADQIATGLRENGFGTVDGIEITSDKQIIAIIAYLQRLGVDISGKEDPFSGLPSNSRMGANIKEN